MSTLFEIKSFQWEYIYVTNHNKRCFMSTIIDKIVSPSNKVFDELSDDTKLSKILISKKYDEK